MPVVTPLVSVVIPNYNNSDFLASCLESALGQSYKNIEVIVVDDGSTDCSMEILLNYQERIQLISTSNQGASSARNIGISRAKGEFIALLDSDDTWELDKIMLQMDKMLREGCDLVYCSGDTIYPNNDTGPKITAKYSGNCYPYYKKFPTRAIIVLGCSSALVRVSLLEISGHFDETFLGAAEDWDFFRRYCKNANVGFLPQVLVHYQKHAGSIAARPNSDWYYGNSEAVKKLFAEDASIGFQKRRGIWAKFQLLAVKTFVRKFEVIQAFAALAKIFLPITKR